MKTSMLDIIEDSLQNDPKNPHLWIKKGNLLLEKENLTEAEKCFNKAVSHGSELPTVIEAMGTFLAITEKYDKSLEWFDKLIKLTPQDLNAWNLKAKLLEEIGEFNKAIDCYQKIIEIKPQASTIYLKIADTYIQLKKDKEAIKYYKQFLSFNPESEYAKEKLTQLKEPLEEDYTQYLPIRFLTEEEFSEKYNYQVTEILHNILEAAYYETNPTSFYNTILGCDLFAFLFEKNGKIERKNGEPKNYIPIFYKIHNQSYGVLKTDNGDVFAHFNGEEETLNIIEQSIDEGILFLLQEYLEYTLTNLAKPDIFVTALLTDPGTQTLFFILDKPLTKKALLNYKKKK